MSHIGSPSDEGLKLLTEKCTAPETLGIHGCLCTAESHAVRVVS
jgi:hypothetical protein